MASLAGSFSVALPLPNGGQQQWDFVLAHWRPRDIFVIKQVGEKMPQKNIFKSAEPIPSARFIPLDRPLVVVQPLNGKHLQGEVSLLDFDHPADACYLFGPDGGDLTGVHLGGREVAHSVYIPTDTPYELRSWVACAVVAYDRATKLRVRGDG